jgi:hypothetical protein
MKQVFLADTGAGVPTAGTQTGNPQPGIPGTQAATKIGPHWFYMITLELVAILTAAGITPSATTYNQVLTAIQTIIPTVLNVLSSFGTNGYFSIAGFWIQWGTHANAADNDTVTFPHAFPNACYGAAGFVINNSASSTVNVQASSWNTTTFNLFCAGFERPPNSVGAFWIAVGH